METAVGLCHIQFPTKGRTTVFRVHHIDEPATGIPRGLPVRAPFVDTVTALVIAENTPHYSATPATSQLLIDTPLGCTKKSISFSFCSAASRASTSLARSISATRLSRLLVSPFNSAAIAAFNVWL